MFVPSAVRKRKAKSLKSVSKRAATESKLVKLSSKSKVDRSIESSVGAFAPASKDAQPKSVAEPKRSRCNGASKRKNIRKSRGARPLAEPCSISRFTYSQKTDQVGEGRFGLVHKARDTLTGDTVAVKALKLKLDSEDEGFPLEVIRELAVLNLLRECGGPNIVRLRAVAFSTNMQHSFLVTDFAEYDLANVIAYAASEPFSPAEVKGLTEQLILGLHALHSHWVMHRDVKVQNVLLNAQGTLQLCDFGSARRFGRAGCKRRTDAAGTGGATGTGRECGEMELENGNNAMTSSGGADDDDDGGRNSEGKDTGTPPRPVKTRERSHSAEEFARFKAAIAEEEAEAVAPVGTGAVAVAEAGGAAKGPEVVARAKAKGDRDAEEDSTATASANAAEVKKAECRPIVWAQLGPDGLPLEADDSSGEVHEDSAGAGGRSECTMTPNMVSGHYRAPELLLGTKDYGTAVDVWAAACIFGEMLSRKVLFPGKSELEQMQLLHNVLGTPTPDRWPAYDELLPWKVKFKPNPKNRLRERFPSRGFDPMNVHSASATSHQVTALDASGFDLLSQMFLYDPGRRMSTATAVRHRWFREQPKGQRLLGAKVEAMKAKHEKAEKAEKAKRVREKAEKAAAALQQKQLAAAAAARQQALAAAKRFAALTGVALPAVATAAAVSPATSLIHQQIAQQTHQIQMRLQQQAQQRLAQQRIFQQFAGAASRNPAAAAAAQAMQKLMAQQLQQQQRMAAIQNFAGGGAATLAALAAAQAIPVKPKPKKAMDFSKLAFADMSTMRSFTGGSGYQGHQ